MRHCTTGPLFPSIRYLLGSPCAVIAAALFTSAGQAAFAQGPGDLMVAPTRVVLDDRKRTAEVSLMNTSDKAATYRVSFLRQRMDENGNVSPVQIPTPGERFADEIVRFAPRQVVIEPHSGQVVRVQLRLPAELESGEYRCNLLFRAVPAVSGLSDTKATEQTQGINIRLTPIYGVSIPLIVRHGATSVSVTLSDLKRIADPDGNPALAGRFNREGSASAFGDLTVFFSPQNSKTFVPVGQIKGIAVYVPNAARNFALKLKPPAGLPLEKGMFHITYRKPSADGGTILAEATLAVP